MNKQVPPALRARGGPQGGDFDPQQAQQAHAQAQAPQSVFNYPHMPQGGYDQPQQYGGGGRGPGK